MQIELRRHVLFIETFLAACTIAKPIAPTSQTVMLAASGTAATELISNETALKLPRPMSRKPVPHETTDALESENRETDPRSDKKVSKSINWIIEAMSFHHLGKPVKAQAAFDKAITMGGDSIPDNDFLECLVYRQLRSEAEVLLDNDVPN